MPSLLERDLTPDQRERCAALGIDVSLPARVRYRDGQIIAVNGIDLTPRERSAVIMFDLPGYVSPVSGKWIEGRAARREDLKRTGCRPYEGRQSEAREAAKVQAGHERKLDHLADKIAREAWRDAPERVRRVFRGK